MRTEIALLFIVINLTCQIYAGNDGITINLANSPNYVTVRNVNSHVITNSKCGVNKARDLKWFVCKIFKLYPHIIYPYIKNEMPISANEFAQYMVSIRPFKT
jgi:hypothetical protein